MNITIIDTPFKLTLYGKSKTHEPAKSYGNELIALLNVVWATVKSHGIPTTGINHVVYGDQDEVFAGVILAQPSEFTSELSTQEFVLKRYAYYKYIGPYSGLPQANIEIRKEIEQRGLKIKAPMIEIYGHWTDDESKLETELLYAIE